MTFGPFSIGPPLTFRWVYLISLFFCRLFGLFRWVNMRNAFECMCILMCFISNFFFHSHNLPIMTTSLYTHSIGRLVFALVYFIFGCTFFVLRLNFRLLNRTLNDDAYTSVRVCVSHNNVCYDRERKQNKTKWLFINCCETENQTVNCIILFIYIYV